mgnify:CR=1 FL=1
MAVNYFGIEVTRRCNLRCPHCFTESGGKAHPGPDTEKLSDMLAQLADYGARTVAFSGGEPLRLTHFNAELEAEVEHDDVEGVARQDLRPQIAVDEGESRRGGKHPRRLLQLLRM